MFSPAVLKIPLFTIPLIVSNLCTEIGVPIFPLHGISIKRNIVFHDAESRKQYYKLRSEVYFCSDNDKEIRRYQLKMRKLYN